MTVGRREQIAADAVIGSRSDGAATQMRRMITFATAVLLLWLTPALAAARSPSAMRWSGTGFARNGNAIEHLTIRGQDAKGHQVFIRFSMANAAYRGGELEVTLRVETKQGTLYEKKTFAKGSFQVDSDKLGITAGPNQLSMDGDKAVLRFALGALRAEGTLELRGSALHTASGGSGGLIERDLITPWGRLQLAIGHKDGRSLQLDATVFAVREASTVTAHRVFDRSVQLHRIGGGQVAIVDYIVMPSERGGKPLGFMALKGKGTSFVGEVSEETRQAQHRDGATSYMVPWSVAVKAQRAAVAAELTMTASRQVSRKDDLAKLPYLARKTVGMLFKPFTFVLDGVFTGGVVDAVARVDGHSRWNYAQTR